MGDIPQDPAFHGQLTCLWRIRKEFFSAFCVETILYIIWTPSRFRITSDSATLQTAAHWLLCPWDFPGMNTGVGPHFLPQGIFLAQGSSLCLSCLGSGFFTSSSIWE